MEIIIIFIIISTNYAGTLQEDTLITAYIKFRSI